MGNCVGCIVSFVFPDEPLFKVNARMHSPEDYQSITLIETLSCQPPAFFFLEPTLIKGNKHMLLSTANLTYILPACKVSNTLHFWSDRLQKNAFS